MTDKTKTENAEPVDYQSRALELELLLQASRDRTMNQANEIDALRVQLTIVTNELEDLRASVQTQADEAGA